MGLKAEEVLAIANKYTEDTVIGMGAIKGDKGDKGEKGDKGDNGHDGLKGDKGDTGNTGAKGDAGITPSISIGSVTSGASPTVTRTGTDANPVFNFTFPKGDKGDKGDTGDAGRDGQDGKSFEIKARFATEEELIEAFPHGPENTGDAYFVGTSSNPDLYVWVTEDEEWVNNGPIAGVKGDKGDKGDTGDDGFSPVASVTKSGKVATITIRDKVGTTTETVSDGDDGDNGASAYEVAVAEGFVGTVTEWLNSLVGDTGNGIYAVTTSEVEGATHLMVKYTSDTTTWVDCGVIASDVPIATTSTAGKVKPDGTTISIDEYGTISSSGSVTAGDGININNGVVSQSVDQMTFTGTHDEWNALTTAEKKRYGFVAFTDDDEAEGIDAYSTTEVKTNKVWIDGKPIYRKVIDIGSLPNTTGKSVNHGISSLGNVVRTYGCVTNGISSQLPLPFVSLSESHCVMYAILETTIDITTGVDRSAYSGWIAVEYTKTTD